MAEAAISLILECPICQEHFSEPRVLPCQHTFCLHCLEKIIDHQSTTESIPCPVCRATYHLSTDGINDLPKNILAGNLIDIVHQVDLHEQTMPGASNTQNRQLCTLDTDECSQPATVYCYVCDVYMCEKCKLAHKRNKSRRKHKAMAVTRATTIQGKTYCPKHKSKLMDIFCEDCNSMICSVCLSQLKQHNLHSLEDKMEDLSGKLDQVLSRTEHYLKAIHKAIEKTQKQTVKVRADVTKLMQKTSVAYRAIRRHVKEQEQRHLASIDECFQQAEKVIAETLDKQETLQDVFHSILLYGQYLSKASAYDLTTNLRSLVKGSEEVSKSVPELRWKVDLTWSDWNVIGDVDRVRLVREGEVNVESDQQLTTVTGQSVTHGDRDVRQLTTFTTQCNKAVVGMVSYHSHLFIVHAMHDKLYVYDDRGMLVRSVLISSWIFWKMRSPGDICLVQGEGNKDSMVINDCDGNCLWWLTTEKQALDVKLGHPQQHMLQYNPCGVSTDRS